MKTGNVWALAGAGVALSGLWGVAAASITQYSNRAAFESAAGTFVVEDFESFGPTNNAFYGTACDFGDFAAENDTTSGGVGGDIVATGAINGSIEIVGVVTLSGGEFRLTFDSPIIALGFDTYNLADQRFDDLVFDNASGDVIAVHDPIDQTRFWGFISDTPFTSMTIRQTGFGVGGGSTDGFRFDNVTYTPSPGAMFPIALLMLAHQTMRSRERADGAAGRHAARR